MLCSKKDPVLYCAACEASHEQHPLLHVLGKTSGPGLFVQRLAVVDDVEVAVQTAQVTLSVMVQIRAGAHPDVFSPASSKVVQNDASYLAPFANSCSIPNEEASTCESVRNTFACVLRHLARCLTNPAKASLRSSSLNSSPCCISVPMLCSCERHGDAT